MPELIRLGWDEARAADFATFAGPGLVPGRVALEHNHVYRVLTTDGEHLAEAAGRLKHQALGRHELPAVGDWVVLRPDPRGGRGVIRRVLPRRGWFSRRAAGRETEEQVVAANIDTVLLVFGLDHPVRPTRLERYLVVAQRGGAEPVIVLNKADLCADVPGAVHQAEQAAGGAAVRAVSAREGSGLEVLDAYLEPGRTMALLGPSGAGKSSLVNRLIGREVLPTGEVREWDARGRHTSVHRQLVLREGGGLLIDTPGMRELQLWEPQQGLEQAFPEITSLSEQCRFRDCRHDQEPGCAVKAAVAAGELVQKRYASYLKLRREQEELEQKLEERSQIVTRRQSRAPGRKRR